MSHHSRLMDGLARSALQSACSSYVAQQLSILPMPSSISQLNSTQLVTRTLASIGRHVSPISSSNLPSSCPAAVVLSCQLTSRRQRRQSATFRSHPYHRYHRRCNTKPRTMPMATRRSSWASRDRPTRLASASSNTIPIQTRTKRCPTPARRTSVRPGWVFSPERRRGIISITSWRWYGRL